MKDEIFANIAITNTCNMKCKMCDFGSGIESPGLSHNYKQGSKIISIEKWIQILDKLKVDTLHISGVEPLLYPKFDNFIEQIKKSFPEITLYLTTNGWLFEKYSKSIIDYVDNTALSIDGIGLLHDRIRQKPNSFVKAYQAVRSLKEANKDVRVSFAINPENYLGMIQFYTIFKNLNIPIIFNHYNYIGKDSCIGFDCEPVNLNFYRLEDIQIQQLWNNIEFCKEARYLPIISDVDSLYAWYNYQPYIYNKNKGGCNVINKVLKGKRYSLVSNGDFIPSVRCWYKIAMGNALEGDIILDDLNKIVEHINKDGLPPPCQRLCCAGKEF